MRIVWPFLASVWLLCSLAFGQEEFDVVGSLLLPREPADTIILAGQITAATPLDLKRALQRRPGATTVELISDGGSVYGALVMAVEIHERALNTRIPEGYGCYSACAFLYLAGAQREIEGLLGVHQVSTDANDLGSEAAQFTVADILDTLSSFGVAPGTMTAMLRTPPDEMHIFSAKEVAEFSLERTAPEAPLSPAPPLPVPSVKPVPVHDTSALTIVAQTPASEVGVWRSERILTVTERVNLSDVLTSNGFTQQMVTAVEGVLLGAFPGTDLPPGARVRILFGPSRTSNSLIPYRLSIYISGDDPTVFEHRATVALTDKGSYVLGMEPSAIQFGDQILGTRDNKEVPPDLSLSGKTARVFPIAQ